VSAWPTALERLPGAVRDDVGTWLAREWAQGRLEPRLLPAGANTLELRALRARLTRALETARAAHAVEYLVDHLDEVTVRRWCWVDAWSLVEQDEDLLLMDDALVVPLLEEAAAGCPKRAYAFTIVEHHVRDAAHASLRAGPEALRAQLRALARFLPAVEASGHDALAAYLRGLQGYAVRRAVSEEEARARIADLWRCHAPAAVTIDSSVRGEWRAQTAAAPNGEEWIVVEAETGGMRLELR
jgi:hypothetical protein